MIAAIITLSSIIILQLMFDLLDSKTSEYFFNTIQKEFFMMKCYKHAMHFWSKHIILNKVTHLVAGFGIALLVQGYTQGNAFAPAWVGWALVAFAVVMHIVACVKK